MTNREWLESLPDEEFAKKLCRVAIDVLMKKSILVIKNVNIIALLERHYG